MITFQSIDKTIAKTLRPTIKTAVKLVLQSKKQNINIISCSNEHMKTINNQVLAHDYYTDIITFPYEVSAAMTEAELLISLDMVQINSEIYKVSFENELLRVVIHGCLHLLGMDDATEEQKNEMRKEENKYLAMLNLSSK